MSVAMLGLGLGAVGEPARAIVQMDYRMPPATPGDDPCRSTRDDRIVVCGRRDNDRYRVGEPAPPRGMVLRRANPFDWDLGGGMRMLPTIMEVQRPDGFLDRRIMLNVRIPF